MTWKETVQENIRFGLIEMLILGMLSREEMYGQQIKKELAKKTHDAYIVEEGSLYGPLYRMESRGLIAKRKVMVGANRFRNYYHLEPAGIEYIRFALAEFDYVMGGVNNLIDEYRPDIAKL